MAKQKKKINAGKFLQDFRVGKSDTELMAIYGLNPNGLQKLLDKLIQRGQLDPSELERTPPGRSDAAQPFDDLDWTAMPPPATVGVVEHSVSEEETDESRCPQCGAQVSETALTCPECGHVLPGEERWARAEPKLKITERIPPLVLGCILSIPIGIALFIFFWYFMLPAQEAKVNRRIDALIKETPGHGTPMEAARAGAMDAALRAVRLEVERLVVEEVLISANEDLTLFTAGRRWTEANNEQRVIWLNTIGRAMRHAKLAVDFEVVDGSGATVALATEESIEFVTPDGFREFHEPSYSTR